MANLENARMLDLKHLGFEMFLKAVDRHIKRLEKNCCKTSLQIVSFPIDFIPGTRRQRNRTAVTAEALVARADCARRVARRRETTLNAAQRMF